MKLQALKKCEASNLFRYASNYLSLVRMLRDMQGSLCIVNQPLTVVVQSC